VELGAETVMMRGSLSSRWVALALFVRASAHESRASAELMQV
jgi:hypothetical protein